MTIQPAPVPKYDLDPATAEKIVGLETRLPSALKAAAAIRVTDDRTDQLATNARAMLKDHEKEAETLRDPIVRPHNAFVREVNARFKKATDAITAALEQLDGRILAYRREKQRLVDEENRRIAAKAEQKRKDEEARVQAEAKQAGYTDQDAQEIAVLEAADAVPAPVLMPEPSKVTRTDFAAAGTVERLDFEVVNLAELVAQFPDVVEVKRGKVLDLGRTLENIGQKAPFEAYGVRFFRKDAIQQR